MVYKFAIPPSFLPKKNWRDVIALERKMMASENCNVSVDGFSGENYIAYKDFKVFFIPTEQNFTKHDYGVIFGSFAICSAKLSVSCNDRLIKLKYDDLDKIWKNFSIYHAKKVYNFKEYGISDKNVGELETLGKRKMLCEDAIA